MNKRKYEIGDVVTLKIYPGNLYIITRIYNGRVEAFSFTYRKEIYFSANPEYNLSACFRGKATKLLLTLKGSNKF